MKKNKRKKPHRVKLSITKKNQLWMALNHCDKGEKKGERVSGDKPFTCNILTMPVQCSNYWGTKINVNKTKVSEV